TYTLTDNAAPSGTLSYYVSGDTTSETLNVEVVTAITEGSVTVDDVTADNNINENEDDGFVTLSGSASGGDISNGDNVRVIINGNTYNTTLSFGTFSFNVLGSDIIANPGFFVYVDSSNEFGHTGSSSGYKSVGTDNSSTFTVTSVDETTITNSTDGFLIDGITVRISTDVVNNRTIIIDSIEYNLGTNNEIFIKNSDLLLTPGTSYTISPKAGQQDLYGNTADHTIGTLDFNYDRFADNYTEAKAITLGDSITGYVHTGDVDYFVLEVPQKGMFNVSTGGFGGTVSLRSLDDKVISTSFPTLVEEGSYLISLSGTTGSYNLSATMNEEYSQEIDLKATPNVIEDNTFSIFDNPNYMYAEGNILYTNYGNSYNLSDKSGSYLGNNLSDKFVIKDGKKIYVSGQNLYIQSISFSPQNVSADLGTGNEGRSVSVVGNTVYVLVGSTVQRYDISDYSNIIKNTTDISLPTLAAGNTYDEILAYEDGVNVYVYAKDANSDAYLFDITDSANVATLKVFSRYGVNDFAIDNGMLFVTTNVGYIFVYDIYSDASKPRQILRFGTSGSSTAIEAHGGNVYVNENGTIKRYRIDFDFDDTTADNVNVFAYELSKVDINSTISMNKYSDSSGNQDIDIFRVDTEYFGDLSFTTTGVDAADLNITIDDDFDFSSPIINNSVFINNTKNTGNVPAGTYYVKISSSDTDSFDNYNLETTFSKTDTVEDRLLNVSLNKLTPISLGVNTAVTIDGVGDIDLFKIVIPSDGELTLTPATTTLSLVSADVNSSSSYAALSNIASLSPIKAGTYYIKATGSSGSFSTSFTSYSSTDEYLKALDVANVGSVYTANTNSINMDGSFINSARSSGIGRLSSDIFISETNKNYLSQASDGTYIYALYRNTYSLDGTTDITEVGVDKFEYINDSKVVLLSDTTVSGATSVSFEYKLKYENNKLYIRTETNWLEYGTTTSFLDSSYLDFEIYNGTTYAVTDSSVEIIGTSTSNSFSNIKSVAVVDGIVYVGTSDEGIKALDTSTLNLIKEIKNAQNITSLESIGNKLYVLDNT
ncbi:MAG: hypothetical protein OQJ77_00530, partial [Thiovulaceae bacterium]|nr:hypothetical protein [Sulfurimonadaceae bacterium]